MAGVKAKQSREHQKGMVDTQPTKGAAPQTGLDDDLEPVKAFVNSALAMKLRGNGVNYCHIVATINTRDDLETLGRLFAALTSCITTVIASPDRFKDLISAIFKFDWGGGSAVTGPFGVLLAHLVSANSTFLLPTLRMLARSLSQAKSEAAAAGDDDDRLTAVHHALRTVLALVPSGFAELFPVLRESFPHRRVEGSALVSYARQLLATAEYIPFLRDKILGVIVEKCLEIDVEIKIEDSGEATLAMDEGPDALLLSEHVYASPQDVHDAPADQQAPEQAVEVDEMAEKLDRIMLLLFEFLEEQVLRDKDAAQRLFDGLALTLEDSILTTHRCKYVQFLLFFLATRDPCCPRVAWSLIRRLTAIGASDDGPAVVRQAGIAFSASYLVRSRCMSGGDVAEALSPLLDAAEEYLNSWSSDTNLHELWFGDGATETEEAREQDEGDDDVGEEVYGTGEAKHVAFYSLCQAVFYVVAFHHSTIGGEDVLGVADADALADEGRKLLRGRLERLACCPLRPLDKCLESVRKEFLRLARVHNLLSPAAVSGLASARPDGHGSRTATSSNGHNALESHFPFDPYILRRSSRFVATPEVYRYWQAVHDVHEEDDALDEHSVTSEDQPVHSDSEDGHDEFECGRPGVMPMSLESRGNGEVFMRRKRVKSRKRERAMSMEDVDSDEEGSGEEGEQDGTSGDESEQDDVTDYGGHDDDVEEESLVRRVRAQSIGSVGDF